jgi:hypothetical protein
LIDAETAQHKSSSRDQGAGESRLPHRSPRQTRVHFQGSIRVVVPRNNPVDAYTMAAIVRDAGLTIEQFKNLL